MAPRVLISDKLSPAAVQIFKDRGIDVDFQPDLGKDKDKLLEIIGQYDGLAIRSATKATEKIIAAASKLKVIGRAGIGVDNVDIPAASKKGIIVMNTPFGNSITTAEHAISLMMAVARQIPEANASTHAGKWEKSRFMGVELTGKTLGVIGAGNIGSIDRAGAEDQADRHQRVGLRRLQHRLDPAGVRVDRAAARGSPCVRAGRQQQNGRGRSQHQARALHLPASWTRVTTVRRALVKTAPATRFTSAGVTRSA